MGPPFLCRQPLASMNSNSRGVHQGFTLVKYVAAMNPRRLLLVLLALVPAFVFAASLAVDPASVKIAIEAHATMHGFTGKLDTATVALDGDAATGVISAATVRFAWADLKTGDTSRDKEMLAWATGTSPEGVFTLSKLTPTSSAETFTAAGTLALNGQSKDVSFPVKIAHSAAGWTVAGETKIDHRDWGLPKIRKFGMLTVDPIVLIRFSLAAKPGA